MTIGEGEITETITLGAGQTVEKDMIVGVGHVVANAYYTAGGDKVDGIGHRLQGASRRRRRSTATREQVTYAYGPDSKFDLPPDDYVLSATVDQADVEQPFSVKVGEAAGREYRHERRRAGDHRAGASKIEIFEAKKDINGNRKSTRLRL